jgi:predicted PhzF superfamily epimerase YddE/YHI9
VTVPLFQVDAFTAEPFAGNPAAVCLLDEEADAGWMQRVAAEMNLSETAFLRPEGSGEPHERGGRSPPRAPRPDDPADRAAGPSEDAAFGLRWFTPEAEVALCGHATLASAHVLWTEGRVPAGRPIRFRTLSGELRASDRDGAIELDFPAIPPVPEDPPAGLLEALGEPARTVRWVGRSRFDYLLELGSEAAVRGLAPDFGRLRQVSTRGVIATAAGEAGGFDYVSRFFAPAVGIDEDPVTGSAHCALGPFWAERLGRAELVGFQASRRGGVVRTRAAGDRVLLGGQAVTVLRGELC